MRARSEAALAGVRSHSRLVECGDDFFVVVMADSRTLYMFVIMELDTR